MLTCPLAAGKVLCSEKDNMTQVCVTKVSLTATMRRTKEHKNNRPAVVCLCTIGACINVCGKLCVTVLLVPC